MGGAELFGLHRRSDAKRRDCPLHLIAAGTEHDDALLGTRLVKCRQQVHQHRAAGDRMEHLVQTGLHAGALAGGKDDRGDGAGRHRIVHEVAALP